MKESAKMIETIALQCVKNCFETNVQVCHYPCDALCPVGELSKPSLICAVLAANFPYSNEIHFFNPAQNKSKTIDKFKCVNVTL